MLERIFELSKKYKSEAVCIAVIFVIFTICTISLWGYFGNLFYDNGREIYLPELILEGKVLYKDIFGMYNPLSYQINAVLYYIFGHNLDVLYFAGAINAFLIVLCIYILSRQFLNKIFSTIFALFITFYIVFNSYTCTNYIFPYAYAFVYALSTMLYSCLFGLLYLKEKQKTHYIVLSSIMLGLSLANKPEFALCTIPIIGLLVYTKANFKTVLTSIFSLIIPTLLSYGILFFQGFTLNDLHQYFIFVHKFFNTAEQQYYNQFSSNFWNIKGFKLIFRDLIAASFIIFMPIVIQKIFKYSKKYVVLAIFLAIITLPIFNYLGIQAVLSYNNLYISWGCLACFFILYQAIKHKNSAFIFLSLFSILSCSRCYFILQWGYNIYFSILPILVCIIYFLKYLNLKILKESSKKVAMSSILILGFFVFSLNVYNKHLYYIPVFHNDKHNVVYFSKYMVEPFNNTVNWILNNTNKDDTVLALPEGPFLNFITKRKTYPKYYHLIPNHISAIGEDTILKDLQENLPDYFVLNNSEYKLYGKNHICEDFGYKICDLIRQNYELKETYDSNYSYRGEQKYFYIKIYKLKR